MTFLKNLLLLFFLFSFSSILSQRDSISTYLNREFKESKIKNDIHYFSIRIKKDTLWENRIFHRDGKILSKRYSKNFNGDILIGKSLKFHRNGKLAEKKYYNLKGNEHGNIITLFNNGNRNFTGSYNNGNPNGLWKYYRFNGKLACKFYYDNKGNIEKYILFDKLGNETKDEEYVKYIKPKFRGGIEKFKSKISNLTDNLSYSINTTIYIKFIIDIDGSIKDVNVVNNIPNKLKKEISGFFESINGWSPAIEMNRIIPYKYSLPITFKTREIDTN